MSRFARYLIPAVAIALTITTIVTVLSVTRVPLNLQAFPDAAEYADSAQRVAWDEGFVTLVHGPIAEAPRYPAGFPLLLSPFGHFGTFPSNVQLGSTLLAVFYVLAMVISAWTLGGSLAAVLAALVVLISPFARQSATYVLSDSLTAGLLIVTVAIVKRPSRPGDRLSGALTGLAASMRLTAGVGLIAAFASDGWRGVIRKLCWALPFLIIVGLLQWAFYGNPLYNGYDYWGAGFSETFKWANIFGPVGTEGPTVYRDMLNSGVMNFVCGCGTGSGVDASIFHMSNFWFYIAVLFGGFWIYAPPVLGIIGLGWAFKHWREPAGRYSLVMVIASMAVLDFYGIQASRFVAGPASLLAVLGCVTLAAGLRRAGAAVSSRVGWLAPAPPSGTAGA